MRFWQPYRPAATASAPALVAAAAAVPRSSRQWHVREYLPVRVRRRLRRWRGGLRVPSVPPVRGLPGLRRSRQLHVRYASAPAKVAVEAAAAAALALAAAAKLLAASAGAAR